MKNGTIALIAALFVLSACSASSSASKKELEAAEFELTASLIESGSYQFTIRSASPSGGKTIQITSLYTMTARDGKYEAHLPYFGRVYSGGYGDSGGIEFNGEPENLQITRNDDKNKISVTFNINSDTEQYTVMLDMGATAFGNLVISSQKKQVISYYGLASGLKD